MRGIGAAAWLFLLLGVAPLAAQDLPPADQLIQRYVEAIGGRAAHLGVTSIHMSGTVEMAALGMQGDFELVQAPPARMRMRMSLPQVGEIVNGYDGEVGWNDSPLTGPTLLEGDELVQTAERADIRGHLRDREIVPGRETLERSEHDGEACWRVRLVWASGRESFDCYSTETGLLLASEDVQLTRMGEVPVTTVYRGYEEVGGMRFPTLLTQRTMGQEQIVTIDEIRVDEADPSDFEPPAQIRALLD